MDHHTKETFQVQGHAAAPEATSSNIQIEGFGAI